MEVSISQIYLRGGAGFDSSENDPPNSTEDSGFEDWQFQSDSENDSSEDNRDESRDDGEEADPYEDDNRDYSL
jgi:hypothetical protein